MALRSSFTEQTLSPLQSLPAMTLMKGGLRGQSRGQHPARQSSLKEDGSMATTATFALREHRGKGLKMNIFLLALDLTAVWNGNWRHMLGYCTGIEYWLTSSEWSTVVFTFRTKICHWTAAAIIIKWCLRAMQWPLYFSNSGLHKNKSLASHKSNYS